MLISVASVLLMSGLAQSSEPLVLLGANRDQAILIDAPTIRKVGESVLYDQITIRSVPEAFYGNRMTRAWRYRVRADCSTKSFQFTGFVMLDGAGGVLADHSAGDAGPMSRPTPGTTSWDGMQMACGADSVPGDRNTFRDVSSAVSSYYAVMDKL